MFVESERSNDMSCEIIPSILVASESEFRKRVSLVAPHVRMLHIDVMDSTFVPGTTWADPDVVASLDLPSFEVHLMIDNPAAAAKKWMKAGAKRVILHVEAKGFVACPHVAINLPTSVASVPASAETVVVMGIVPGASGRPFHKDAIKKVRELKRLRPKLFVEVDGGVSKENIPALVAAGADGLIAASSIFNTPDPIASLKHLQTLCRPSTTQK